MRSRSAGWSALVEEMGEGDEGEGGRGEELGHGIEVSHSSWGSVRVRTGWGGGRGGGTYVGPDDAVLDAALWDALEPSPLPDAHLAFLRAMLHGFDAALEVSHVIELVLLIIIKF